MSQPLLIEHTHQPVYRVVRRSWADPLDTSHSQKRRENRWNMPEFRALYCCCSEWVARAVALDVFRLAGIVLEDLQPAYRPQLAEVSWTGQVADVASAEGVAAAGFSPEYPAGASTLQTQAFARTCHEGGVEGIVCRSASLARMGLWAWEGTHERWGEVAIFVANCEQAPALLARRRNLAWLQWPGPRIK
ncbi:MAG: RES domain-containing protein [Acidobacteria bacterium]|nr:RES domain-containing protein [Acidobacteriota bacterium]